MSTTGDKVAKAKRVMDRQTLRGIQRLVRQIVVAPHVADAAARMTMATHPGQAGAPDTITRYVRFGASPRAMQALLLAGRASALVAGRAWVGVEDLVAVARPVLRHRMILGFDATLDGITTDALIGAVVESVS